VAHWLPPVRHAGRRLALCELDLVVLLGPDHPDATAAKEARDVFTELGAQPFLERLNRAAGLEQAAG